MVEKSQTEDEYSTMAIRFADLRFHATTKKQFINNWNEPWELISHKSMIIYGEFHLAIKKQIINRWKNEEIINRGRRICSLY